LSYRNRGGEEGRGEGEEELAQSLTGTKRDLIETIQMMKTSGHRKTSKSSLRLAHPRVKNVIAIIIIIIIIIFAVLVIIYNETAIEFMPPLHLCSRRCRINISPKPATGPGLRMFIITSAVSRMNE